MKRGRRGTPLVVSSRTSRLGRALDELRFGAGRTLNLRESLPLPDEAVRRAESWLREMQVSRTDEVLVITGRGEQQPRRSLPVREAVRTHLGRLRRMGVVESFHEHTAGLFVVRPAPLGSLFAAPRSRRHEAQLPAQPAAALEGLGDDIRQRLNTLAVRSLESLGIASPTAAQVERELERQFSLLAAGLPESGDRERRLLAAIQDAIRDLDDA